MRVPSGDQLGWAFSTSVVCVSSRQPVPFGCTTPIWLPFAGTFLDVLQRKQTEEPPPPATVSPGVPDDLNRLCVELLRIDGLGGDDVVVAHGSFNVNRVEIDGGDGNDSLEGSLGKDTLCGGPGNDARGDHGGATG